jgi:hypothetical protein
MDEHAAEKTAHGYCYGDSKRSTHADADEPPGSSAVFLGKSAPGGIIQRPPP